MILVAITVVAATLAGVFCDRRGDWAGGLSRLCLTLMLYVLVPLVSYVSFAHLKLSAGAGAGLGIAYVGLGLAGSAVWLLGRRIGMARPAVGGVIVAVIVVNTGYLGYPMAVALIGQQALPHAVAYDQVVSTPMLFTAGFAVGAIFGDGEFSACRVLKRLLLRNPPLVAAVAGLLVPASWAPHILVSASHVVVDALLVLGFFAVGVQLATERHEDGASPLELPDRAVMIAVLGRFCVNPALLGVVALAGVGIPTAYLLQSLMPTGISSLIIGHVYGLDQRLIATVIVWDTLIVLAVGTAIYLL